MTSCIEQTSPSTIGSNPAFKKSAFSSFNPLASKEERPVKKQEDFYGAGLNKIVEIPEAFWNFSAERDLTGSSCAAEIKKKYLKSKNKASSSSKTKTEKRSWKNIEYYLQPYIRCCFQKVEPQLTSDEHLSISQQLKGRLTQVRIRNIFKCKTFCARFNEQYLAEDKLLQLFANLKDRSGRPSKHRSNLMAIYAPIKFFLLNQECPDYRAALEECRHDSKYRVLSPNIAQYYMGSSEEKQETTQVKDSAEKRKSKWHNVEYYLQSHIRRCWEKMDHSPLPEKDVNMIDTALKRRLRKSDVKAIFRVPQFQTEFAQKFLDTGVLKEQLLGNQSLSHSERLKQIYQPLEYFLRHADCKSYSQAEALFKTCKCAKCDVNG